MRDKKIINKIKNGRNWISIEPLNKGWSDDRKYLIVDKSNRKILLRLSTFKSYGRKKNEYDKIKELSNFDIHISRAIDFGFSEEDDYVYMLLTWVEGKDTETNLKDLPENIQYDLGFQSGKILQKIHSIFPTVSTESWETVYTKKIDRVFKAYKNCDIKLKYENKAIDFIQNNLHLLKDRNITFQHGDYHVGNFIITSDNKLGVIDFNRCSYGDPWEEYDRYVFTWRISEAFAKGQLDGYFNNNIPDKFLRLMAFYTAVNMVSSIPWAIPFGNKEVESMQKNNDLIHDCYDCFNTYIPKWHS